MWTGLPENKLSKSWLAPTQLCTSWFSDQTNQLATSLAPGFSSRQDSKQSSEQYINTTFEWKQSILLLQRHSSQDCGSTNQPSSWLSPFHLLAQFCRGEQGLSIKKARDPYCTASKPRNAEQCWATYFWGSPHTILLVLTFQPAKFRWRRFVSALY